MENILFEQVLLEENQHESIDIIVTEFVNLYFQAKKQVKFVSAYYLSPNGPILSGDTRIREAENESNNDDLYWAEEAKKKGERILVSLQNKNYWMK
jgi:hypothetical protein